MGEVCLLSAGVCQVAWKKPVSAAIAGSEYYARHLRATQRARGCMCFGTPVPRLRSQRHHVDGLNLLQTLETRFDTVITYGWRQPRRRRLSITDFW